MKIARSGSKPEGLRYQRPCERNMFGRSGVCSSSLQRGRQSKVMVFFSGSWQPSPVPWLSRLVRLLLADRSGIGPQFDQLLLTSASFLPTEAGHGCGESAYLRHAGHICTAVGVRCTSVASLQMHLKMFAAFCTRPCALFALSGSNFYSAIHCPRQGFLLNESEWKLVSVDASKLPLFGPRRLMDWDTRVSFAFVPQG
jgi:hypothetical protein